MIAQFRPFLAQFLVAAMGAISACASSPSALDLLIDEVTVYTGREEPFVADVGIRDGKFVLIDRTGARRFAAARTIEGSGKFLTPGLWDMHTHLRSSEEGGLDPAAFVRHGVISVRDLGGYPERIEAVRAAIAAGAPGPAIYSTFRMLNGEAFAPYQRVVTNRAEAVAAIEELVRLGAAQTKIHRALAPEMLPVVLAAAHERGLSVTGHIPLGVHPLEACEAGMDGVEHVGSFLEAYSSVTSATAEAAIEYLLSSAADPLYRCLATRSVEVTPTLVIYPVIAKKRAGGEELPQAFVDFIDGVKRITLRLHRAGITLLSGTDTSDLTENLAVPPGSYLVDELVLMQEAGIPAREIIAIATINAARALSVADRVGTIEVGKTADFLLLDRDPGADIGHLREPLAVFVSGRDVLSAILN